MLEIYVLMKLDIYIGGYIKHETFCFCFGTMHTQTNRQFRIDSAEIHRIVYELSFNINFYKNKFRECY